MKKILNKAVSMLVSLCLMIGVSNIPAYSATVIGTAKTSDGYALQKTYITPVQAVKKAVKSSAKSTEKPVATKVTTKKVTVSSAVNKLAIRGINTINKIIKKKGTSKVAKTWLKKAKTIISNIKNGKKNNKEKKALLNEALTSIEAVAKAGATDLALVKQTAVSKGVFSSLKTVLKNNLTYKIYAKYAEKGIKVLKAIANKFRITLKSAYNCFVKYGVTKKQVKIAGSAVISVIKRGVRLDNCGSLATARYLNISVNSAALQNFIAEISIDAAGFAKHLNESKRIISTYSDSIAKVLDKNGVNNAELFHVSKKELLNMKKGQKVVLIAGCYSGKVHVDDHAITVVREKDGKYGVYDVLMNGGNKIIYTASEFKKFLNGKSAKGKTSSGRTIVKPVYLNSSSGNIRYAFGTPLIITDSGYFVGSTISKSFKICTDMINELANKKNLNSAAKDWLIKAKKLINETKTAYKRHSDKYKWFSAAIVTLLSIVQANGSMKSFENATNIWYSPFSSLKSTLE